METLRAHGRQVSSHMIHGLSQICWSRKLAEQFRTGHLAEMGGSMQNLTESHATVFGSRELTDGTHGSSHYSETCTSHSSEHEFWHEGEIQQKRTEHHATYVANGLKFYWLKLFA